MGCDVLHASNLAPWNPRVTDSSRFGDGLGGFAKDHQVVENRSNGALIVGESIEIHPGNEGGDAVACFPHVLQALSFTTRHSGGL